MKTILKKYRDNLVFSKEETQVINEAIENNVFSTDDLIEDFWRFRDRELKDFIEFDEQELFDFNEYYDNGLTHTQNFIKLINFFSK